MLNLYQTEFLILPVKPAPLCLSIPVNVSSILPGAEATTLPGVVNTRRGVSLGSISEAANLMALLSNVAVNLVETSPGAYVPEEWRCWVVRPPLLVFLLLMYLGACSLSVPKELPHSFSQLHGFLCLKWTIICLELFKLSCS